MRTFKGPLANLTPTQRKALLTFADVSAQSTRIGSEAYKGKTYMVVDLGRDDNVYNDLQLNQVKRVSRVLSNRLFGLLKAFTAPVTGVREIEGLKLELMIPHRSFLDRQSAAELDRLELYSTSDAISRFAEDEITSQALVDESVVIVNGNRISVPLTD